MATANFHEIQSFHSRRSYDKRIREATCKTARPQSIPWAECFALADTELGSPLARNFHLRCIELSGAKADGRFNALKLPRIFEALQLQRLNSRMSWDAAASSTSA